MWISGNCWLFILLGLLTLPRLLIKHFVLISHISTLLRGWPLIMVKWACFSGAGGQEQAPPRISIILHPRSSQGPGAKSKESLLSITKLFNTVISRMFFIPSPFAIGNETWWKIWCVVLHTNKGPWLSLSFTVMEDGSATIRNAYRLIRSICKTEAGNPDNWLCWVGVLFYHSSRFDTG